MVDASTRQNAWTKLEDRATSAVELEGIAEKYPEFSQAIAVHPNASPELREWAKRNVLAQFVTPIDQSDSAWSANFTRKFSPAVLLFVAVLVVEYIVQVLSGFILSDHTPPAVRAVQLFAHRYIGPIGIAALVILFGKTFPRKVLALSALLLGLVLKMVQPWYMESHSVDETLVFLSVGSVVQLVALALAFAVVRPVYKLGWIGLLLLVALPELARTLIEKLYMTIDIFQGSLTFVFMGGVVLLVCAGSLLLADGLSTLSTESRVSLSSRRIDLAERSHNDNRGYDQPNTLALLSLVLSFFVNIAGIVLGHIALAQIQRTGENGRGLAIAGLVIGYISIGCFIIFILTYIAATASTYSY